MDDFWDLDVSGCLSPLEMSPNRANTKKRIDLEDGTIGKTDWCKHFLVGRQIMKTPHSNVSVWSADV